MDEHEHAEWMTWEKGADSGELPAFYMVNRVAALRVSISHYFVFLFPSLIFFFVDSLCNKDACSYSRHNSRRRRPVHCRVLLQDEGMKKSEIFCRRREKVQIVE